MLSNEEERYLKKEKVHVYGKILNKLPHLVISIVKHEGKNKMGLRRIKQFLSNTDAYHCRKEYNENLNDVIL